MHQLAGGLWPVMLTPFHENNELDLDALRRLTSFYLAAGVDGLFANCLSSEMFQLTDQERLTITKTVVEEAGNQIPIVATGTFGKDLNRNVDFIKKIYDQGVTAVVINTNQLTEFGAPEAAFQEKLDKIIQLTGDIPLGLYECPVPYKRLLSPKLLKYLGESKRFFYFKETSCQLEDILLKIEAVQNSPLGVYNANIPTGFKSLLAGATGLSPIGANFFPELYSYLIRFKDQPAKREKVEYLDSELTILDAIIHQNYPLSAKWFLQKRGLDIGLNCRTLTSPITQQDYIQLEVMERRFYKLASQLEITPTRFSSNTTTEN